VTAEMATNDTKMVETATATEKSLNTIINTDSYMASSSIRETTGF